MKVIKVENQVEGGKVAFEILKEKLANGAQTLGLATGSSPLEFYKEIVESDLDFSNLTSVNLDEYVGLDGDNPQSYRYFMQENLFNQKPFKESFLPRGVKDNAEAEVKRYNQILADHPVDLQILGIGRNGHIGFNEPGTPFDSQTHLVLSKPMLASLTRLKMFQLKPFQWELKTSWMPSQLFSLLTVSRKQKPSLEQCLVQ